MNETVKLERTHWRDEALSERHRHWGYDCPATDIDFLLIEFDRKMPCALVDYKHALKPTQPKSASTSAMANLGSLANIPAFICGYAEDFSWFWPIPLNSQAEMWISERNGKQLSEREWVELLYRMRKREFPDNLGGLNDYRR